MSRPFNDLSGQKIGNLLVVDRAENNKWGKVCWNCIYDFGKKKVITAHQLIRKNNNIGEIKGLAIVSRTVIDLSGQKIGNLLVVDRAKNSERGNACWNCICDCGKKIVVSGDLLTRKKQPKTHCGCLTSKHYSDRQKGKTNAITHGLSKTPEYSTELQHRRRIKIRNINQGSILSYVESLEMARLELDYCVYCGSTENLSIDHIIPIDKGGTQDSKNLIRACRFCNSAKSASFFIDWYIKTNRVKRKLDDILKDMGFDSIVHLQNYQDSMCPEHIEKDFNVRFHKLVKADMKDIDKLLDSL